MTRRWLALLLFLGATIPAAPARAVDLSVRPQLGLLVGHTSYGLEFEGMAGLPVGVGAGSALDYPLNSPVAGMELSLGGRLGGPRRWDVVLLGLTNLVHPFGTMDDSDYVVSNQQKQEFSYTESDSQGRVVLADLSLRLTLLDHELESKRLRADLRLGYRHEQFDFDVYGAEGWQLSSTGKVTVSIPDDAHALHADGYHLLPYVGMGLLTDWFGRFLLETEVRLFVVRSRVHDDHILRRKDGTGTGWGAGLLAGLAPRWVAASGKRWVFAVGGELEFQYTHAGGRLEQQFYGDDPSIPGDETGVEIPDTDFRATTLQFRMGITGRLSF